MNQLWARFGFRLFILAVVLIAILLIATSLLAPYAGETISAELQSELRIVVGAFCERFGAEDDAIMAALEARALERERALVEGVVSALPGEAGLLARRLAEAERLQGEEAARGRSLELGARRQADWAAAWESWVSNKESGPRAVGHASVSRFLLPALALAGLGLVLFALAIAWLHRRQVARPLHGLAAVMGEVASGGERRVAPGGDPAVRAALLGFNQMVDALAAIRRELEIRVDLKTAALAQALEEQTRLNERLRSVLRELEEAQERLVRQEKMAAIGTLAGGVAHEFNNLLGGIRGCAEDLLEEVLEPGNRQSLEVIRRATQRGRKIVEGLLRFSQAASREPVVIPLSGIVEDVRALTSRLAAERAIQLSLAVNPALRVMADPAELHQVILNVVTNAIQMSPPRSEVVVTAARSGTRAVIEVSDRGPGIAQSHMSRILEPFFTTREREGGTGLGLAISHGIVQALGGTLSFRPREGGGTTFVIELPLSD